MKRSLLLLTAAALVLPLASAPTALAGTYTVSDSTPENIDGWTLKTSYNFFGCSFASAPGPCAEADMPSSSSPLRLFAYHNVHDQGEGSWTWEAPPTVSIASGSVRVTYAASPDVRVFMKARLRSSTFTAQPQLYTATGSGATTWDIPADNEAIAVYLKTLADHTFPNKWANTIRIDSLDAVLRDDTPPSASLSGVLASGQWLNQTQQVCATVKATDAGSGVVAAELREGVAAPYDSDQHPVEQVRQPGDPDYSHDLCLTPSRLADGEHDLVVGVTDAAKEATQVPLTILVDTHAPAAIGMSPARTTDRRAPVTFQVDAGASGLSSFQAWVDDQPMAVDGITASYQPAADLAYGTHTVTWSATDQAGNHRDAFWTFQVADDAPPAMSDPAPAPGSGFELRRPALGFTLTDAGSGVNPASLRVLLDGTDVAPLGAIVDDRFAYTPASDLAYGHHTVVVGASDRSGNAMSAQTWGFDVIDSTPPVIGDARPDDGSSGADRTPVIAFTATDAGAGIDPASLSVTLDGDDVTARFVSAGGRFAFTPSDPLAYGRHTVVARIADRSGNAAAPVSWSFQIRDEVPPAITDRKPAPGTTLVGSAAISFSVADAGTGLDESSLQVTVDGSDVTSWGRLSAGRFVYDPGNLGAGVHTVSVTVADTSGNVAGPVMWQFAVVDPARLDVAAVSGPSRITAGDRATLRFRATAGGAPLPGAGLRITSRPAGQGSFGDGHTLVADASGAVSWTVRPNVSTDYRVELAGDDSVSAQRTVIVAQRVGLAARDGSVRRGTAIRLTGSVTPAHRGATVQVQLLTAHGWRTVAAPRLSRSSTFGATLLPRVAGRYAFRVVAAPTAANASGTSRTVTVRVR